MAGKTYSTRAIAALTGVVSVWMWLYMLTIVGWLAATVYRLTLLQALHPDEYLTSVDPVPGHEDEAVIGGLAALGMVVVAVITGFIVLRWCHRASRNTNAMARGVQTRPHWAIWWWFIPFASLFKPFGVFSEFWRVARNPDGWKSVGDPVRLRWWWGFNLASGFTGGVANAADRAFTTVGEQIIGSGLLCAMMAFQLVAGVMFVGIVREIGKRQTTLITAGRIKPSLDHIPGWAPEA